MSVLSKDFSPIQDDYEFFVRHSTEADSELEAYADHLASFNPPPGPLRILDFGCGPGSFTARFLGERGWERDRL